MNDSPFTEFISDTPINSNPFLLMSIKIPSFDNIHTPIGYISKSAFNDSMLYGDLLSVLLCVVLLIYLRNANAHTPKIINKTKNTIMPLLFKMLTILCKETELLLSIEDCIVS